MMYLALGTGIVWVFILGYVYSIFNKLGKVEKEISNLEVELTK